MALRSRPWRGCCRVCSASWAGRRSHGEPSRRSAWSSCSCRPNWPPWVSSRPCSCTWGRAAGRCIMSRTACLTACSACCAGRRYSRRCPARFSTRSRAHRRICMTPSFMAGAARCSPGAWGNWTTAATGRPSAATSSASRGCSRLSFIGRCSAKSCLNKPWPACQQRT
ncbi:hypothetical protein D9M71_669350 [compost metagenome]